jgi:hypothetical protein
MTKSKGFRKNLLLWFLGLLFFFIQCQGNASQDLPTSGEFKPLSGINRGGLDKLQEASSWGRNPFYFPRAGVNGNQERPSAFDGSGLQLSAILYHPEGSVAIINHQIVRQGDEVAGKKVVSILENRVIMQDLSGVTELRLSPFSLK